MISIVTPCSRPENLPLLAKSIKEYVMPFTDAKWYVSFDTSRTKMIEPDIQGIHVHFSGAEGGVSGNTQRNDAISYIKDMDSWVYVLDDDNTMHPKFYTVLHATKMKGIKLVTFDQESYHGVIRSGSKPLLDQIDQAQFLIHRSIQTEYIQNYGADGYMIMGLTEKYPNKWVYINSVASYYNKLRWQ